VATVLGLVGRDLVLDIVTAVVDETPAAAFELAGRAVELGYDLRLVCRELTRVVRDLLVLSVDPSRINDPEIAAESERDRLKALAARFSREDLLRSFDVLSKAEYEIRSAAEPRYHLEMALLRWMHLRKLVPLTELLQSLSLGGSSAAPAGQAGIMTPPRTPMVVPPKAAPSPAGGGELASPKPPPREEPATPSPRDGGREAFLEEIRRSKEVFYKTVVAQAQKIEFGSDRVVFSFLPIHRMQREQLEQNRQWLESIAGGVSGKKMLVVSSQQDVPADAPAPQAGAAAPRPVDLKAAAMSDAAVQAMLDVFPAEIEDVEEIT
jgi:DNA polymerase-3 subunit gamma/tau